MCGGGKKREGPLYTQIYAKKKPTNLNIDNYTQFWEGGKVEK